MKKNVTIEAYVKELESQIARARAFEKVLKHVNSELHWMCDRLVKEDGYYDTYTDENGEEKRTYHPPVYDTDADGEYIYIEPSEDAYNYDEFVALKKVEAEIRALV